jgi:hypothetical protein
MHMSGPGLRSFPITTPTSPTSLYAVNLATGKATLRGAFMATDRVIDIAIPLGQP